jgi:GGDEF domain-containing protein
VEYNEFRIPISVSIGLTAYPEVCTDTDDLLKRADWCMYYAKEHGRHQICVDDGSIQNV